MNGYYNTVEENTQTVVLNESSNSRQRLCKSAKTKFIDFCFLAYLYVFGYGAKNFKIYFIYTRRRTQGGKEREREKEIVKNIFQ